MSGGHLKLGTVKDSFKALFSKIPWFLPVLAVLFSFGSALLCLGYSLPSINMIPSSVSAAKDVHAEYGSDYIGAGAYRGYAEEDIGLPQGSITTYVFDSDPSIYIGPYSTYFDGIPEVLASNETSISEVASYYLQQGVGDSVHGFRISSIFDSDVDLEKLKADYPLGTALSELPISYAEMAMYVNEIELSDILVVGKYGVNYSLPSDSNISGFLEDRPWLYLEYKGNNQVRSYAYSLSLQGENMVISGYSLLAASLVFAFVFFAIYGKTAMEYSHPLRNESYWASFGLGCLGILVISFLVGLVPPLVIYFCSLSATGYALFPISALPFLLVPLFAFLVMMALLALAWPIALKREKKQSKTLF